MGEIAQGSKALDQVKMNVPIFRVFTNEKTDTLRLNDSSSVHKTNLYLPRLLTYTQPR